MKTSVLLAAGVNAEGDLELLGRQVATSESVASWTGFFRDLKSHGLNEVYLVTSGAHLGTQHAISGVLPNSSWQRCRTHSAKNLSGIVPNLNGRPFRRRFTPSFNHSMRHQYRAKLVRWWRFVRINSRMLLATWKKP